MFRVNFGNGQISHRMKTKRDALAYIDACKAQGSDPHTASYFVQRREIGDAECAGEWVRVKS